MCCSKAWVENVVGLAVVFFDIAERFNAFDKEIVLSRCPEIYYRCFDFYGVPVGGKLKLLLSLFDPDLYIALVMLMQANNS